MEDSDDDFGDFDEQDMQGACTQAENILQDLSQAQTQHSDGGRSPKRRKVGESGRSVDVHLSSTRNIRGSEDSMPAQASDDDIRPKEVCPRSAAVATSRSRPLARTHADKKPISKGCQTISSSKTLSDEFDYGAEVANLPSGAFSSPPSAGLDAPQMIEISSQQDYGARWDNELSKPRLRGPQTNLKQTTLFGGQAEAAGSQPQSQSARRHNFPLVNRNEPPTHHKLDHENVQTWIYPTNLGSIREYQYTIVSKALYSNLLVALPTGLGKTFIAAAVMLNWYRWTKDAQIVFVAPTKPLVSQQVDACFNIVGIPRSDTTMLTGNTQPGIRAEEWNEKRVFFMTPQTIMNDLKTGIADPKRIVLLVVDEAHRATGSYAYVEVVKFLRRFNTSFRVLALTATPGSSVEGVQEVIDGLGMARTEIRTEESIDIREYVHHRNIETNVFENSEEMGVIMELFGKVLQKPLKRLISQNCYFSSDPMKLTPYMCNQQRQKWMNSDAGKRAPMGTKWMVNAISSMLASLAQAVELLNFHGIGPCYHKLASFQSETLKTSKKGTTRMQLIEDENFKKMMSTIQARMRGQDFVGHPKLEFLREVVLNHFLDAGEGRGVGSNQISPAKTRIMVFVHYRDSAEEVVRVLKRNEPMIRPHVFVGQAASRDSEGMGQKKQLEIIEKFKSGVYNTLVATSIGEEGLDIGEVDLIVCYDASASPIRMLQRMGRTGRKRAGKIEILLMKGKEQEKFRSAQDNYEKMQKMITEGSRFNYHSDLSYRILPRDIQPVVDKRAIDIPIENSQPGLPEPKKRSKVPKRPPKKFHMPDNVRTGFTKASRLDDSGTSDVEDEGPQRPPSPPCEPVVPIQDVLLTKEEQESLDRDFLHIDGPEPQLIGPPDVNAFPSLQRASRPTSHLTHGRACKTFARMMEAIHNIAGVSDNDDIYQRSLLASDVEELDNYFKSRKQPRSSTSEFNVGLGQSSLDGTDEETNDLDNPDSLDGQDDIDDDDSLRDFIEDDETPIGANRVRSPVSSPPAMLEDDLPPSSMLSEGDLPCLDDLIGQNQPAVALHYGRRKRAIIDSDEEI